MKDHTTTGTPGEVISWRREGEKVIVSSNLAKNEFVLDYDQALDIAAGVAILAGRIMEEKR